MTDLLYHFSLILDLTVLVAVILFKVMKNKLSVSFAAAVEKKLKLIIYGIIGTHLLLIGTCTRCIGYWIATHYPDNHSGFDIREFYSLAVPCALISLGSLIIMRSKKEFRLTCCILILNLLFVSLIFFIDHNNIMVEHDLWAARGAPYPFQHR